MRVNRKMKAAICQILVGLLLFTQAAFAMQPCVEAGMSAVSALAAAEGHEGCETSISERTACALQCLDESKLSAQPQVTLPQRHDQAALTPPAAVDGTTSALDPDSRCTSARDPPKTIRFCTLLI